MGSKSNFAADAAKAGLILGGINFVFDSLSPLFNVGIEVGGYISWASILAMAIGIHYFGKKRALKKGDLGNTFGEALGFTLTSMFYTGIIVGLGVYLLNVHIAPEYYEPRWILTASLMEGYFGASSTDIMENALDLMRNPIVMVFTGIFYTMLNGGILGLFISPFLKREANIFRDEDEK